MKKWFKKHAYILAFYIIPCVLLVVLCIKEFYHIEEKIGDSNSISVVLVVSLLLGLILAALAIITLVASYREISRLHNYKCNDEISEGIRDTLDDLYKKVETKATEKAVADILQESFDDVIRAMAQNNRNNS